MPRMKPDETRSTTARAFSVLDALADAPRGTLSLSEIAAEAMLPVPTAFRYVRELLDWGGIERTDDGRYRLGMHMWQIGTRARWDRVRQLCLPALEQLTRATGLGACVTATRSGRVVTLERRWGAVRSLWINPVGQEIPLAVSTAGLLSIALTDQRIESHLAGVPARQMASAERVLGEARSRGFAVGTGLMREDQGEISVPVPGEFAAELALTLIFPAGRTDPEAHVEQLRLAAATLAVAIRRGLATAASVRAPRPPCGSVSVSERPIPGGRSRVDIVGVPDVDSDRKDAMPHTTATVRDVAYADRGATPLQFDLHYATDAGPLPLVLYFHGGGWARGARTDAEQARIIPMAAAGFAVASVSYRLSGTDVWPAQLEDARTAFDAVPEIVAGLGVPLSGRTTVWGSSAGGHIALMLALTAAERGLPGPAAAVALFPPADLTRMTTAPLPETTRRPPFVPADGPLPAFERALLALDRAADPESAQREASPVSHATAAAPPILLLHGDEDGLISPWHTARLLRALREAGAPATALYVAGAAHEDPAFDTAVIRAAVAAHLRGEPGDR